MAQNLLNGKALEAFNVPKDVYNAIKNAAAKTGVNFSYLMEKAAVESSFDADAKSKTSSASGLFQFIESTWLGMVRDHGDKYGLSAYADKIDANGRVSDKAARKEILELRNDPEIASLMAAEFDTQNYQQLKQNVGGRVGPTELYIAHFLGAGGASGFLNALRKSPDMAAADIFPREARANRSVFYDAKTGAPKSMREVYAFFDNKFDSGMAGNVQVADNTAQSKAPTMANVALRQKNNANDDNTYAAIAMQNASRNASVLRTSNTDTASVKDWRVFPQALYSNLSLSPAQMMLLSDFNA